MNLHEQAEPERAHVVLVGGLDPGAGAGVLRDLLTAVELGAQATVLVTSITEQDSTSVTSAQPRESDRVGRSLALALARGPGPGVKIGMVASAGIALAIADALQGARGAVVYDPVLRASSGGWLYQGSRDAILDLARRVTLLTPNLGEAAWLLEQPVESLADADAAARALVGLGIPAVLVKGGHLAGDATDVLMDARGQRVFSSPRIPGPSPRGTGCALSTAIAVGLCRGQTLESAVAGAKTWLTSKIAGARKVGDEWHL
jgi:hydroxymethylpyrimidine kinase/phosphomethylpyrimidine kinase